MDTNVSRLGTMAEVGVELPADRRFFLDLALRAHLIPGKDIDMAEPNRCC